MTNIFVGEYGKVIYVDTQYNLSSATNLEIHFSAPPGGTSFLNSTSVSVLASNLTNSACGVVFSANKTAVYKVNQGDISGSAAAGNWKVWIEADFGATVHLISSSFRFKASQPGG
jgi:hypothetical protein